MPAEASPRFGLLVHATHEAGVKVGGIGAVLAGLLSTHAYREHVARTILVGPMDSTDATELERLIAPRNQLEIRYSSHHDLDRLGTGLSARLRAIEQQYDVKLLYGTRAFGSARHEVILIDAARADPSLVNAYKGDLYRRFRISSDRYESHPEYRLHVHAAEPAYLALQAVADQVEGRRYLIAHEFMGLPLCYTAMMRSPGTYRTVFYGHEVATVRPIVESQPGHDTMFYNVLDHAQRGGLYLEDVFGDQSGFFKHALIRPAATHCDNILAVGDSVVKEMRFLGADWAEANIDLAYNGVPSRRIALAERQTSHNRLQRYCSSLLGYVPDYVFTHVTRFIPSKGLWRDIRVMEHLDPLLAREAKSAVLFALSTVAPMGRPAKAVFAMEDQYGWPVVHRQMPVRIDGQDVPDLTSHEIPFYQAIVQHNREAQATKILLVNQFGWSQDRCGRRMPADMTFADIRQGSDLEFGQSIYEPFGIAQLEPLTFGALCVVSSICGCVGFVRRANGGDHPNVIVADYTDVGAEITGAGAALSIGRARRDRIESAQAGAVAAQIIARLPTDDAAAEESLDRGYALSRRMSWEVVTSDYLLPALVRAERGAQTRDLLATDTGGKDV